VARRILMAGDVVAGDYETSHMLGEGSSGEVWAATHTSTGEQVALKVLARGAAEDGELAKRFQREAYFLKRTACQHVARIHDFVSDPEVGMVLVMERVEGESLAALLDARRMSVEEAIGFGLDLLDGVQLLHAARVIHRDLKPGNILMRRSPDGRLQPVICDFGLSRISPSRGEDAASIPSMTALTKRNVAMGTVKYMAPEQVLNADQATEQSDLYAVAAILHRAVTGLPPFGDLPSPGHIAHAKIIGEAEPMDSGRTDAVALAFERLVTKALSRRPAQRFADAASMRAALEAIAQRSRGSSSEEETQNAPAPLPAPLASPVAPRRRSPLVLAAGIAAVFVAGVATGRVWTSETRAGTSTQAAIVASSTPLVTGDVPTPPLTPTPELVLLDEEGDPATR
jgi:serine/threonine-protein kinase